MTLDIVFKQNAIDKLQPIDLVRELIHLSPWITHKQTYFLDWYGYILCCPKPEDNVKCFGHDCAHKLTDRQTLPSATIHFWLLGSITI